MAGSKAEAAGGAQSKEPPARGTVNPAAFTLVHFVSGSRRALFQAQRLMNPVTYIGRTPDNDVVLGSENVSRRHAKLIVTDGGVTVHDLDSHNGIFLNGKKVRSTPMSVGDLLYVADVCIELRKSPDGGGPSFTGQSARVQQTEISAEEDPSARSLAALMRATEVVAGADEDACNIQTIEICRELCEATVAALVLQSEDGALEAPVVLQPENARRGEIPVIWPIVKKAMEDGLAQFSADLAKHPIVKDDAITKSGMGAVMCVPIAGATKPDGALYLARPSPGHVFTDAELETVAAIANLLSMRRQRSSASSGMSVDSVEPAGDVLAAKAKAEAAEERLREAQADVRSLTERIHSLEADALKLKQQIEVEKQNAVEAKREAERGRSEASKLEQGLHKTDEDFKKLRETLKHSEEDRGKLRENIKALDEDRRNKSAEIDRLTQEKKVVDLTLEETKRKLAEANAEIERVTDEAQKTREALEKTIAERVAQADALRSAVRSIIPTTVAEHVETTAEGRPAATELVVRPVAALTIGLYGMDQWAAKAPPADVKKRLDHFCSSVALRTRANGGRIEQVLGHEHLALFAADAASVRAAMRAGLEISALVPPTEGVGVICALHVGNGAAGFFGDEEHATRIEAGEAAFVSRALSRLSLEPVFFATDAVQKLVGTDPAFTLALLGPTAIVGGPTLSLYKVTAPEGRGQ